MPTQAASRAGCDLSRASPPGICRATSAGAVPSSAWVRTSRPSAACRLPIAPAQHENRTEPSHRLLLLLIVAHAIVVLLFTWIARYPGAVWDDMLEAWSWGQHFELGYYKHPPFYSWIAGIWLRV